MQEQNISAAERTIRRFEQADSPEAIRAYFSFLLYTLKDERQLDEKKIIEHAANLQFKTVADAFKLIEGADCTVYIPVGEGAALTRELRENGPNRSLLRKLGEYGVSVYRDYFTHLRDAGALEIISENAGILLDTGLYSPETGLPFDVSEQSNVII